MHAEAVLQKKKLGDQEELIAKMKLVNETNKRLSAILKKKLDVSVAAVHKRQNSFDLALDYTGIYMGDHRDLSNYET